MTATEELFKIMNPQDGKLPSWAKKFAIKLTELHVKAALEAADKIYVNKVYYGKQPLSKDEIINSYPLTLIK